NSQAKTKTPLPKIRLGLTLFVLFSEPMSSQCIFPFINQVSEMCSSVKKGSTM
ncbi:hypothetical protein EDD17DRAFT_1672704, partial [Pisolithus thermaeus]